MLIGVIGAGGWGTALAKLLSEKGHAVTLWCHDPETLKQIRDNGENRYLPGVPLPVSVELTGALSQASSGKELIVAVTPSHNMREVMSSAKPHIAQNASILCGSKGIEETSLLTMSEVLLDILGPHFRTRLACLSGPTFALEVAYGLPAAVTVASADEVLSIKIQETLSTRDLRVYTSHDMTGVQLGGVVKNVIAIAAGISDGLELGNNARAALITRGLAEMTRLAVRLGANAMTLAGLPGLGDLVLTCTGDLSRNRRVGLEIAQGRALSDILANTKTIAEGVRNTRSIWLLARRTGIEMPIVEQMYLVLYEGKSPSQAVRDLMQRSLKRETG